MNRKSWSTLAIALVLVAAQLAYKKYQYHQISEKAGEIHDVAMKDMAEMNRLGRQIKKELLAADSLKITPTRRDSLEKLLQNMDAAEADMMAWMTGFKADEPLLPMKNELNYIREQQAKIEKNAADILLARDAAKNLVK